MALGDDPHDSLAYDLVQTAFDAVERDGYRAEWTDDDARVRVFPLAEGAEAAVVYDGEDLVRAASDRELRNARNPPNSPE